jgi:hypothetical protein
VNSEGAEEGGGEEAVAARRRLAGFAGHLAAYFIASAVFVVVSIVFTPGQTWIFLPIVGWGAVLAFHAAYAMGLFGWVRRK